MPGSGLGRLRALLVEPSAGGAYTLTAQHGTYTVTGQSATITRNRALTASAGSYAVTGQSAGIAIGRVLTAQSGAYTLAGQSADIEYSGTAANYELVCEPGSYTVTGSDAGIEWTQAAPAVGGGGGVRHTRRRKSAKQIRQERIRLGILPPEVQEAVEAAAEKIIETPQPAKPVLVRALKARQVDYRPAYLDALTRYVNALQTIEQADALMRRLRRERDDEEALMLLL